jgi:hypothetical protein
MKPQHGKVLREKQLDSDPHDLAHLTIVPAEVLRRAIQHDLDVPCSLLLSEEDSRIAISQAIQEALEAQNSNVYTLHERTGLSCDFIEKMLDGSGDIRDSDPLQRIQAALGVRLSHL